MRISDIDTFVEREPVDMTVTTIAITEAEREMIDKLIIEKYEQLKRRRDRYGEHMSTRDLQKMRDKRKQLMRLRTKIGKGADDGESQEV